MNALLWLKRLGWPGLVGLACLLGVAWLERAWLPAQQEQVQRTESDARRLRHELQARADAAAASASAASAAAGGVDPRAGPRAVWAVLWEGLPDAAARLALQRGVLQSAADAGIALGSVQLRGEFENWLDKAPAPSGNPGSPGSAQGLWRQRMVLPVQTSYPALRTWIDALLRQPALSIDALDIQRADPMSDQVKAQVSVSLWWRQDRGH